MIEKANSDGLTAEDFAGATFGVTSTGNIGGRYLLPFISRPKVAIIGFGQSYTIAKWEESIIRPEQVISYSISADHRVLDGATVAKFGSRVKQLLEEPDQMLMKMQ